MPATVISWRYRFPGLAVRLRRSELQSTAQAMVAGRGARPILFTQTRRGPTISNGQPVIGLEPADFMGTSILRGMMALTSHSLALLTVGRHGKVLVPSQS